MEKVNSGAARPTYGNWITDTSSNMYNRLLQVQEIIELKKKNHERSLPIESKSFSTETETQKNLSFPISYLAERLSAFCIYSNQTWHLSYTLIIKPLFHKKITAHPTFFSSYLTPLQIKINKSMTKQSSISIKITLNHCKAHNDAVPISRKV